MRLDKEKIGLATVIISLLTAIINLVNSLFGRD